MPPPDPRDPEDFSDSDQEWFDRLGPAPRPPAQTPAQREGDALKQAMRIADAKLAQRPDIRNALSDEARQRRFQRIQASLADPEPVVAPPAQPPRPAAPSPGAWSRLRQWLEGSLLGPRWPAAGALALAVALGTVIVPVWMNDHIYERPEQLKGADDVRQVDAERPRQAAEAFAAELVRAGLKPGLYQRGKTFVVDIDVDRAQLPAASPAFARIGVEPRLGFTRVEFDPRPSR